MFMYILPAAKAPETGFSWVEAPADVQEVASKVVSPDAGLCLGAFSEQTGSVS